MKIDPPEAEWMSLRSVFLKSATYLNHRQFSEPRHIYIEIYFAALCTKLRLKDMNYV